MKKIVILMGLFLALIAFPARAELPPEVLDKEYEACAGDGQDAQRDAYCACVRDQMRNWTEQDYMDTAQAASASHGASAVTPSKLTEVAKECIAKTLH